MEEKNITQQKKLQQQRESDRKKFKFISIFFVCFALLLYVSYIKENSLIYRGEKFSIFKVFLKISTFFCRWENFSISLEWHFHIHMCDFDHNLIYIGYFQFNSLTCSNKYNVIGFFTRRFYLWINCNLCESISDRKNFHH
jgi:hypothetical protein